ncbi:hypothetical protein JW766_02605 [Candidatus Dojkabacteria bacterium]|nr:hypothetical protein [Candidatus Dojkabacteria bacterium]
MIEQRSNTAVPEVDPRVALEGAEGEYVLFTRQTLAVEGSRGCAEYLFPLYWDSIISTRPMTMEATIAFCGDIVIWGDTFFDRNVVLDTLNDGRLDDIIEGKVMIPQASPRFERWEQFSYRTRLQIAIHEFPGYILNVVFPHKPLTLANLDYERRVSTNVVIRDVFSRMMSGYYDEQEVDHILAISRMSPYSQEPFVHSDPDTPEEYAVSGVFLQHVEEAELPGLAPLAYDISLDLIGGSFNQIYLCTVRILRVVYSTLAALRGYDEKRIVENSWAYAVS